MDGGVTHQSGSLLAALQHAIQLEKLPVVDADGRCSVRRGSSRCTKWSCGRAVCPWTVTPCLGPVQLAAHPWLPARCLPAGAPPPDQWPAAVPAAESAPPRLRSRSHGQHKRRRQHQAAVECSSLAIGPLIRPPCRTDRELPSIPAAPHRAAQSTRRPGPRALLPRVAGREPPPVGRTGNDGERGAQERAGEGRGWQGGALPPQRHKKPSSALPCCRASE